MLNYRTIYCIMSLCNFLVFLYSILAIINDHSNDAFSHLRDIFYHKDLNVSKYSYFSDHERLHYKEEARKMFYYGYDNYMMHAFPEDELNPIYCRGRGPDYSNPSNININDVLGNYCLTLVDSLSTLAIIGNHSEFKLAVRRVIDVVHFDKNSTVQVFEANIRLLGALLSSHLLIKDPEKPLGELSPDFEYEDELLHLAHDLATRLLVAFENSPTGIPFPRVNLQKGIPSETYNSTCTAGAGSLLLEFGVLSRLLRDPVYENVARRALRAIRQRRSSHTGLVGNVLNVKTGDWEGTMAGVGAGLDSYFEYLLKTYIMFGETEDYEAFQEAYGSIKKHARRGRADCNAGQGDHPMYVNVDMDSGLLSNNWVDSLSAAFPAMQVLAGDVEEAICSHAIHYLIWSKYGALPERFNWRLKAPDVSFYPLRPELIESTYFLYQATKNPFYLHVGKEIIENINQHARTDCGYATIHNVHDKSLEDRMESFFLSETCKYLYLLFDIDHVINRRQQEFLFSTEGHLFRLSAQMRKNPTAFESERDSRDCLGAPLFQNSTNYCSSINEERRYAFPLKLDYYRQLQAFVGVK